MQQLTSQQHGVIGNESLRLCQEKNNNTKCNAYFSVEKVIKYL